MLRRTTELASTTTGEIRQTVTGWMEQYGQDVWVFIYAAVRNQDVADDLTQEVFLRAFRHANQFRQASSVKTWLFAIARNAVRDHRRSAFVRRVQLVDDVAHHVESTMEPSQLPSPEVEDAWPLVMQLKEADREVIVLRLRDDLSFAEISSITHVSEPALRVRYQRALKRLRKLYRKGGDPNA